MKYFYALVATFAQRVVGWADRRLGKSFTLQTAGNDSTFEVEDGV